MSQNETVGNIAQLGNVTELGVLVATVVNRHPNLPPLGVFYGASGAGKTFAAAWNANLYKAYYVEVKSLWTRKRFFEAILQEMQIIPEKTIGAMFDQVCAQLALSRRPLFVDDCQYLAKGDKLEMVKDIAEGSQGSIILIGEDALPQALRRWERIDNRVLAWAQAKPCTVADARKLLPMYAPEVEVADELLAKVCSEVKGCTRRVCTNLNTMREYANKNPDTGRLTPENYKQPIYTGNPKGA